MSFGMSMTHTYTGHAYSNTFLLVYLKLKFNWAPVILFVHLAAPSQRVFLSLQL